MKNAAMSDQDFGEPYGAEAPAGAPGYLSSRRQRHRTVEQEATGLPGAHLPHDIISEMEAALQQQVDRLVAKRH